MIQHHTPTSSPNHPRSNGFIERMVGVAKKLMDKAGKEGKLWISGLFNYRVTPSQVALHHPGKRTYLNFPMHLVPKRCTKLARSSSRGKGRSQKEITQNCYQVHQFGYSTGRMLHGNQQNGKPVCTKLLLDNGGEWCRAIKSVQAY